MKKIEPNTKIAKVEIGSVSVQAPFSVIKPVSEISMNVYSSDPDTLVNLLNVKRDGCSNVYIFSDHQRVHPGIFIKNVYVNEAKKTIAVKFADGTVIKKTACKEDTFDLYAGVALCLATYLAGSTKNLHKFVDKKVKNSAKSKAE